jgi:uncharacterized protein YkwD
MEPITPANAKPAHPMRGLVGILALLIFAIFTLSTVDRYVLNSDSLAAVISAVLVDLVNDDRSDNAAGALVVNPVLVAAAQAKANDMAAKGYFAHVSPDGTNSWYWFREAGYTFTYAGENLAVDFSDSIDVERAWMNSPTHRANLLNGNFTEIGIATAEGTYKGRSTTFVVQMFGTPAPKNIPAAVVETITSPKEPTAPALATTKPVTPTVAAATSSAPTAAVTAGPPQTLVLGTEADSILTPSTTWWQRLIASPKSSLLYAYALIGGLILALLAFVTELEFHKRHLHHVGATAFLFVLMLGLFALANLTFFTTPVIAAVAR